MQKFFLLALIVKTEKHGKARANEKNIGQARILAKRAALMDGYRNLSKAAGKVQITAKDTLSEKKLMS